MQPEPFAAMVPATPLDKTWVVETGRPKMSATDRGGRDQFGRGALPVGQVGLADLLAHRHHDALPAHHGPRPSAMATHTLTQSGMNCVASSVRLDRP